jgi:ribosome modulation factor
MSNELSAQELLPPEIGLTLLGFEQSEQGWLVRAAGRSRSECPACRTQSTARHSRCRFSLIRERKKVGGGWRLTL